MKPKVRVEKSMADSLTLSSQRCYDSTQRLKPFDIACGGWSEKLNSSLCCPPNYQCMTNGLCMLPDNETASSGAKTYPPQDPARQIAAWVQLPTCTSRDWRECAFNPLSCFSESQSVTTGFIPKNGCTDEADRLVLPGDWISCGTIGSYKSTCSSTQLASDLWAPPGGVLCPSGRDQFNMSTSCTGKPYGADDPSKSGAYASPDDVGVPLVIVYPIVIFLCLGLLGGLVWYLLHKKRRRAATLVVTMERRRSHDSWDQGLPAYECHPSAADWIVPRRDFGETVWGEPPPDYYPPKQPESAHVEPSRDVEAAVVEEHPATESTRPSQVATNQ